jgi:alkylhydroperoxidase family enzyme
VTAAARIAAVEPDRGPARFDELVPDGYRALLGLDGSVWLEPVLRALVQTRTAQLDGSPDRLARHVRDAIELGETHRRLTALADWRRSSEFSVRERAALQLADALAAPSSRRTVENARRTADRHFDEREVAQLVLACAATSAWGRLELGLPAGDSSSVDRTHERLTAVRRRDVRCGQSGSSRGKRTRGDSR